MRKDMKQILGRLVLRGCKSNWKGKKGGQLTGHQKYGEVAHLDNFSISEDKNAFHAHYCTAGDEKMEETTPFFPACQAFQGATERTRPRAVH